MKHLNQNSRAAGKAANEFRHEHANMIVRLLQFLKMDDKSSNRAGWTPYDISVASYFYSGFNKKIRLEVAQIFRRMSELVASGLVEVTPTAGTTPSGRKCMRYRLNKKCK